MGLISVGEGLLQASALQLGRSWRRSVLAGNLMHRTPVKEWEDHAFDRNIVLAEQIQQSEKPQMKIDTSLQLHKLAVPCKDNNCGKTE
jgi:hypothetical protein